MVQIDYYSTTSIPIKTLYSNEVLSRATAFFYKRNNALYLVSNWHVFSGRNTYTGQAMHSTGAIPDEFSMTLHLKNRLGAFQKDQRMGLLQENGSPVWLQHPTGQKVDVAVAKILLEETNTFACNEIAPASELKNMQISVATEVYILGFPKGIAKQGPIPVWKRGTIASEPDIQIDGNDMFLIDTLSSEGMSGAPVIARPSGPVRQHDGSTAIFTGEVTKFLGIYSGRYGVKEMDAQLGRVWARSYIDEVIDFGVPGDYEILK